MVTNLDVLKEACSQLLRFNDLWVIGNLTDTNFEEGDRSPHVKRVIHTYQQAGMPEGRVSWVRDGVNGLLAQLIERNNAGIFVTRNKSKGQDLIWGPPGAKAEVTCAFVPPLTRWATLSIRPEFPH